jgi:ankyrin repeat protein
MQKTQNETKGSLLAITLILADNPAYLN